MEPHARQVRGREARLRELGARDDRWVDAAERLGELEVLGRQRDAGVARRRAPAQDVEHLVALDADAVADDAVLGGR